MWVSIFVHNEPVSGTYNVSRSAASAISRRSAEVLWNQSEIISNLGLLMALLIWERAVASPDTVLAKFSGMERGL